MLVALKLVMRFNYDLIQIMWFDSNDFEHFYGLKIEPYFQHCDCNMIPEFTSPVWCRRRPWSPLRKSARVPRRTKSSWRPSGRVPCNDIIFYATTVKHDELIHELDNQRSASRHTGEWREQWGLGVENLFCFPATPSAGDSAKLTKGWY